MSAPPEVNAEADATLPTSAEDLAGETARAGHYGRFEVHGTLGAGGMGIVLAARDPDLDRRVALKILRPDLFAGESRGEADLRLTREAQAMARLAHPNVVTVYEVGRVGDHRFVAMELVEGTTLRGWLAAAPRGWREIVAMFIGAGRGLAAAHAAGLVHRDFKPDNVLVGADGRPRVTDFGLVADGPPTIDDPPDEPLAADVTGRGTAVGTPAYMSAEQWAGQVVDPRSDQFSFCVALWEALHGARPFAGRKAGDIRRAVAAGAVTAPRRDDVPRWLQAVVRRGLAPSPADRWPSMAELLDALERWRRGRRWGLVAAVGVVGALGGVALALQGTSAPAVVDPCAPPTARLEAVWSPPRRAQLATSMGRADPALGAARFAVVGAAFDDLAARWTATHVAACRATRIEGRQSDTMLDRRMDCLDRALVGLGEAVRALAPAASPGELDRAIRVLDALPDLAACSDPGLLGDRPAPPTEAAARREFRALGEELAAIDVARVAGKLDGLVARAEQAVGRARALGHVTRLAEALDALASAQHNDGSYDAELTTRRELITVAAAAHDDILAAEAWTAIVSTTADSLDRPADAEPLLLSAAAAVARAGDPVGLRYDLLEVRSELASGKGDVAGAQALIAEAVALLEASGARAPGSPLASRLASAINQTGSVMQSAGKWREAVTAYRETIALRTARYGADHPLLLSVHGNLAEAYRHLGEDDAALAEMMTAARIGEARMAPSPRLAQVIGRVGSLLTVARRHAAALPYFDRAIAMARATMAADDLRLAGMIGDSAGALMALGQLDLALARNEEELATYAKANRPSVNWALGLINRGQILAALKRWAEATVAYERALAMLLTVSGPDSVYTAHVLVLLARAHASRADWPQVLTHAARALATKLSYEDSGELILAHYWHGVALAESRRDVRGGIAEAKAARGRDDAARLRHRPRDAGGGRRLARGARRDLSARPEVMATAPRAARCRTSGPAGSGCAATPSGPMTRGSCSSGCGGARR